MKFYMYPLAYRRYTEGCKRVCLFAIVGFLVLLPPIGLIPEGLDVKATTTLALCLALPFVFIYAMLWHRGCKYEGAVFFEKDRIRVIAKGGKCKREILYAAVTDLGVQELECDFSTRYFRGSTQIKHICFFLNGCTQIPKENYHLLFWHQDFFMMEYTEEAWE